MARATPRPAARRPAPPARRPTSMPGRAAARANPVGFLRDIISEVRKVTWPTPEQAWRLAGIVIIISIAIGAILGGIDVVFSAVMRALLGF